MSNEGLSKELSVEDLIKSIDAENQNITRINQEGNKSIATKEVWSERLVVGLADYKEKFGVDLSIDGGDMGDIRRLVKEEFDKVYAETKKALDLSSKMVRLIDSGDIDGAWDLVGGKPESLKAKEVLPITTATTEVIVEEGVTPVVESKVEKVVEEVVEKVIEQTTEVKKPGGLFGGFMDKVKQADSVGGVDDLMVASDGSDFVDVVENKESKKPVNRIVMDDDDDDIIIQPKREEKKTEEKKIISWDVDDDDDEVDAPQQEKIFGNFGNILSGSRLENK